MLLCFYDLILSVQLVLHSCISNPPPNWDEARMRGHSTYSNLRPHHLSDQLPQPNYYIWNSDSALIAPTPLAPMFLQLQTPRLKQLWLQHFALDILTSSELWPLWSFDNIGVLTLWQLWSYNPSWPNLIIMRDWRGKCCSSNNSVWFLYQKSYKVSESNLQYKRISPVKNNLSFKLKIYTANNHMFKYEINTFKRRVAIKSMAENKG